jgi:hypothetical protein
MKTPDAKKQAVPWDQDTELLLVVALWQADLKWLCTQQEFPYVVSEKLSTDPVCGIPVNKGAEASAYLKFIINQYTQLPQNIAFLDEHERSWHQPFDIIEKLRGLRIDMNRGFIPLNNLRIDSEERFRSWRYDLFKPVWDAVVRPHLGKECPVRIVCDGSSQFVVSRDRILARTLSLYKDLYAYAIGSKHWPGDEKWQDAAGYPYCPGGDPDSWKGGVYFLEWIWHIIFGEDPVLYPIQTG